MYSLTYVSSAGRPFSHAELQLLLATSRRNNEAAGITGILLYKDGNFMQVLEGERAVVLATKARIDADPRHHGVLNLLEVEIETREFGVWSMAFRDLATVQAAQVPGYDEFLNTPLTDPRFAQDPSTSQKLLTMFKRNM